MLQEVHLSWRLCLMHTKWPTAPVVPCIDCSAQPNLNCVLTEHSPSPEHTSWDSQAQKSGVSWWWFCCWGFFRDVNLKKKKNLTDANTGFPVSGRQLRNKLKNQVYNYRLLMAKLWNKETVLGADYGHAEELEPQEPDLICTPKEATENVTEGDSRKQSAVISCHSLAVKEAQEVTAETHLCLVNFFLLTEGNITQGLTDRRGKFGRWLTPLFASRGEHSVIMRNVKLIARQPCFCLLIVTKTTSSSGVRCVFESALLWRAYGFSLVLERRCIIIT